MENENRYTLLYSVGYVIFFSVGVEKCGDSPIAFLETGRGVCAMNTLEVLTLVLVIFTVLTYLDNHNRKK